MSADRAADRCIARSPRDDQRPAIGCSPLGPKH
jgi:hypothetical protein